MNPLVISYTGKLPGQPPPDTFLIGTEADFCTACDHLRHHTGQEFDAMWVRKEYHFAWLKVFVEHTGLDLHRPVDFQHTTARQILGLKWRKTIPEWLNDDLILKGGLLETEVPDDAKQSVEMDLLGPFLGDIVEASPFKQAGILAERCCREAMVEALEENPVLSAAWDHLLKTWAASPTPGWAAAFYARLRSSPSKLWRDFSIWRLLRDYPLSAQEFALEPAAVSFLRNLPSTALDGMTLQDTGKKLALEQIAPYFQEQMNGEMTHAKIESMISAVSGKLHEEFVRIQAALEKNSAKVTSTDIAGLIRRFADCEGVTAAALDKLKLFIRPPKPSNPEPTVKQDAKFWMSWFHSEYMPYRWWQTQRAEADLEVEVMAGKFSEWYCEDFLKVHSDPALSAVQILTRWKPQIQDDSISLILLVDNLPWFFWETFERALGAAGLHKHESRTCFTPLPSHTSVCKPAIVSGEWSVSGSDYLKMLEIRTKADWNSKAVRYFPGVDQLTALDPIPAPSVLLLNFLASDNTLHEDLAAAGTNHADAMAVLFGNLGKAVGDFARRAREGGNRFGLYVITDHGSSQILEPERKSIDAKLSQKLFANEKHRSATLTDIEAAAIPENLWALGHRFHSPYANDGSVHFIPRGHNTVAAPKARPVYCHGGATPEEVLIPCAVFRLNSADWLAPKVRLVDPQSRPDGKFGFYIKRMTNLKFEIQNPNAGECSLEAVRVVSEVAEVREAGAITVGSESTGQTAISLYFLGAAVGVEILTLEFHFRVAQTDLVTKLELPVNIASVMSTGTNLDSLFS